MGGARRGPRHERVQLGRPGLVAISLVLWAMVLGSCSSSSTPTSGLVPTATPEEVATPTPLTPSQTPTPVAATSTPPVSTPSEGPIPDAPDRDSFDLARRYLGVNAVPLSSDRLYPDDAIGERRAFWVLTIAGPSFRRQEADLRYLSEHAMWYVATGGDVSNAAVQRAATAFEEDVYDQTIATFADGKQPDGRITVLTVPIPGLGGYFSSVDALPTAVYGFSNERAVVYMNSAVGMGSMSYTGTLAHEFQHLVHSLSDSNESTWVNEGLSELASRLLDLPSLPFSAYLRDPEVSVVNWPETPGEALPNYAGSSLFAAYLARRTGVENIHRLVGQELDGVPGVQAYLDETAPGLTFEDVYADWLVANLLNAEAGPYGYDSAPGQVTIGRTLDGPGTIEGTVNQLGGWYLNIETDTPLELSFEGQLTTPVLAERPHSQDACWWSNRGDNIDSTLTREFDLTGLARATLTFWSWYAIEEHWDHGYVSVSTDGGVTWRALAGAAASTDDPVGTAIGPSYTGSSGGWVKDQIDLTSFAGQAILLRFEYLTDDAINATGWCIDDLEIAELGFTDDAESDGAWVAEGFVRLRASGVPQRFLARLVTGEGDGAVVAIIEVDARNRWTLVVEKDAVLIVTAVAPKTSQPASFTLTAE